MNNNARMERLFKQKDLRPCLPDVGAHDNVIGIRSGSHAMTRFSGP